MVVKRRQVQPNKPLNSTAEQVWFDGLPGLFRLMGNLKSEIRMMEVSS